jgi:hypothetical protein
VVYASFFSPAIPSRRNEMNRVRDLCLVIKTDKVVRDFHLLVKKENGGKWTIPQLIEIDGKYWGGDERSACPICFQGEE